MYQTERVAENLNRALHELFKEEEHLYLLGEDILDPYGGAFKISSGLSTLYPDRVLTTPISEQSIVGVGAGLALCGNKVIVEIMFGDFLTLCFDQILNFATKAVAIYGHELTNPLLIRCPVGGNRGYGPTHSQSLQKHFLGIPHLTLFEISPFHDNTDLFKKMIALGHPCLLFEDKTVYTQRMYQRGPLDELFTFDFLDQNMNYAHISLQDEPEYSCVILAPGGLTQRVLTAVRNLFLELECVCQVLIPAQIYPFDLEPILPFLEQAKHICIVEEGVGGGTWGSEVAQQIYTRLWKKLQHPVLLVSSQEEIIPTAPHLEKQVLVQSDTIYHAIKGQLYA